MLNLLSFILGISLGTAWIAYLIGYFQSDQFQLFIRTFQNKYIQPIESVGWNGELKSFLANIQTERYWEKPTVNPFGTR